MAACTAFFQNHYIARNIYSLAPPAGGGPYDCLGDPDRYYITIYGGSDLVQAVKYNDKSFAVDMTGALNRNTPNGLGCGQQGSPCLPISIQEDSTLYRRNGEVTGQPGVRALPDWVYMHNSYNGP